MSFPKFVSTARTVELSAPLKHIKQLRRISQYDSPFFQSRLAGALGVGACLGAAFLTSPIMNYSRKGLPSTINKDYEKASDQYLKLQGADPISYPDNNLKKSWKGTWGEKAMAQRKAEKEEEDDDE